MDEPDVLYGTAKLCDVKKKKKERDLKSLVKDTGLYNKFFLFFLSVQYVHDIHVYTGSTWMSYSHIFFFFHVTVQISNLEKRWLYSIQLLY